MGFVAATRYVVSVALDDLPFADAGRETHARELFRLDMSPEEYAARFGHQFVLFPFDNYRYSLPGLTEWVQRLGDIFFARNGAPSLRHVREQFLSPEEIAAVELEEQDPL